MSEHDEQVALMRWAKTNENNYPELAMLYAIPNGGKRHQGTARKLRAEGTKAGVWDLSLDVPRDNYHGMKIEMKFGRNGLQPEQEWWGDMYAMYGYYTAVCWSWVDAASAILIYLGYEVPKDLR